MKIDDENKNDNENEKNLNVYNLKTYIGLKILAEKKNKKNLLRLLIDDRVWFKNNFINAYQL